MCSKDKFCNASYEFMKLLVIKNIIIFNSKIRFFELLRFNQI
ncbi:hypothetical protein HMPREF9089_01037 [Eubacterium brachy ATCC 33089]|nr:hypothetical protein HMPREF9089_01037 [Eubacterium brachy ATCC 33089]